MTHARNNYIIGARQEVGVGQLDLFQYPYYRNNIQLKNILLNDSVVGLAGKFFNNDWTSTITTGNIGTLPLTTANDSSNITSTATLPSPSHAAGVNLWSTSISYSSLGVNYGFIAIGYFTAPATGTYTFFTSSDDSSGVWLGDIASATSGRTAANATVNNNLGAGQATTKRSGTITLYSGFVYAIRIVHTQGSGPNAMTFSWSGPGITETTSLATHFRTPTIGGVLTGNYITV